MVVLKRTASRPYQGGYALRFLFPFMACLVMFMAVVAATVIPASSGFNFASLVVSFVMSAVFAIEAYLFIRRSQVGIHVADGSVEIRRTFSVRSFPVTTVQGCTVRHIERRFGRRRAVPSLISAAGPPTDIVWLATGDLNTVGGDSAEGIARAVDRALASRHARFPESPIPPEGRPSTIDG